ncbi:Protein of unknown function [Cotesia congregata]|uniref:Endonuclease/exonuclease/phosphatase domain-containing protein n=1 Tax=Cotesia congregata TaxID=51543 RepID=A0A8J2HGV6_COTCN|nr:Protein of unknown function [Cotesia congregata]
MFINKKKKIGHPANYAGCPYMKFEKHQRMEEIKYKNKVLKKKIEMHNLKRYELHSRTEQYNPDIVLISESKLTNKHYPLSQTYKIVRTDRPNSKQGRGTAIMITSSMKHQVKSYPTSLNNELFEFTIIQLLPETLSDKKIFVISGYATNSNRKIFINELDDLLQRLDLSNPKHFFILAGDLNARRIEWGDSNDNQRGKYLRRWETETINKYRASIYTTDVPSFTPAQTFLDVCITNLSLTGLSAGNKITTVDYDSDHRALLFTVILPSKMQTENDIRIPRRNLRAIKWKKFEKNLNAEFTQDLPDDRNLSVQELDDSIINLTSALVTSMNKTAPTIKQEEGILKYLNTKIKKLQENKTKAIKLLHSTQNSSSLN